MIIEKVFLPEIPVSLLKRLDLRIPFPRFTNLEQLFEINAFSPRKCHYMSGAFGKDSLFSPSSSAYSAPSRCARCKGIKKMCGKPFCPIIKRNAAVRAVEDAIGKKTSLFGPSPPAVFVGDWGYPKIFAGPLVPPVDLVGLGDPAMYDDPTQWLGPTPVSLSRLLEMRASLVRGKHAIQVTDAREPFGTPVLANLQEMVLSIKPVDSEMHFHKPPRYAALFDNHVPPMGPSSDIETLRLTDNPTVPRKVDRLVYDTDVKAGDAVTELTQASITHQQIQRVFSVGLLGMSRARRLVPTRWSITAVDDIIGKFLHKKVKSLPWINEVRVYRAEALANSVTILLYPSAWQFEVLEGWTSAAPKVESDWEFHRGRTTYASTIEGAYYAVRHPILNWLLAHQRQAGALVFLEVDTPRWVPLGVWRFRELAQLALQRLPHIFENMGYALASIGRQLLVPLPIWTQKSHLLEVHSTQRTIEDYFKASPKKLQKSEILSLPSVS